MQKTFAILSITTTLLFTGPGTALTKSLSWPMFLPAITSAADPEIPTVISAGQIWMDRNLGASQVATSLDDSAAYGDLYQWGRGMDGHEKRTSSRTSILSNSDVPGHSSFITAENYPSDWRTPQNNDLWQGVSGTNNPCPSGFRLPTYTEFETERRSWHTSNAAGAFASPLKLVAAGYRHRSHGEIKVVGSYGLYWLSSVRGTNVGHLRFSSGSAGNFKDYYRAGGFSVRCIKD